MVINKKWFFSDFTFQYDWHQNEDDQELVQTLSDNDNDFNSDCDNTSSSNEDENENFNTNVSEVRMYEYAEKYIYGEERLITQSYITKLLYVWMCEEA